MGNTFALYEGSTFWFKHGLCLLGINQQCEIQLIMKNLYTKQYIKIRRDKHGSYVSDITLIELLTSSSLDGEKVGLDK